MDNQINKTIGYFLDMLDGSFLLMNEMTSVFYAQYCAFCAEDRVKPRKRDYVIRDACKALGISTKRKHYTVFCEKVSK